MERLLKNNTMAKYYVEYMGYRSNHLAHGIIALHRLGATDEQLEKFTERYIERLEPAGDHPDQNKPSNVDDLLGKRKSFYYVLEHYERSLQDNYGGDLEKFLEAEFMKLSRGIIAAALHGLIQSGYGYSIRNPRAVCEGLAYLHFASTPLTLTSDRPVASFLGQGTCDPFQVVEKLRQDEDLYQFLLDSVKNKVIGDHDDSVFTPSVSPLVMQRGDALSRYVQQIQFPKTVNLEVRSKESVKSVVKFALDCAVLVYLTAETRNHFFLLHGVTGAWGLYNVIDTVRDFDSAIDAVHTFLCALLATYLTVGRPRLLPDVATTPCDAQWSELVERTVSSELDEHIYKVVQVCHDMVSADDGGMERVYRLAAHSALTYELDFTMAADVLRH